MQARNRILRSIKSALENLGRCYLEAYEGPSTFLSPNEEIGQSCPLPVLEHAGDGQVPVEILRGTEPRGAKAQSERLAGRTDLLIIGAGPFGLAMAAYARHLGLNYLIVGQPMGFWKSNMPAGMLLRSASDWPLDPVGPHTIGKFLEVRRQTRSDLEPLSREFYLSYAEWFRQQAQIDPLPFRVRALDCGYDTLPFEATTDDGQMIRARRVVIAIGCQYFRHCPRELVRRLPRNRYSHTCDLVDFRPLEGKRCLILGGRQSAFEWTALLNEAGATAVHLSYRHDSPRFEPSDWSWVLPVVDGMIDDPGWFRRLPQHDKEAITYRLWAEGRLKVEPWLESRVMKDSVTLWPRTCLSRVDAAPHGAMRVTLDNDKTFTVDHIILATGYRCDIGKVPFLSRGNVINALARYDGFPVLDEHFQTNIPGLFVTSMPAARDFGPFLRFTVSVRASARIIGHELLQRRRMPMRTVPGKRKHAQPPSSRPLRGAN